MKYFRTLRWRLVFAPLLVAAIGTGCMLLLTYVIAFQYAPGLLNRELATLLQNPGQVETTRQVLLLQFQRTLTRSVAVAALVALAGGVVYSFVLWRSLVVPLRDVAASSQRIASGRYSERVDLPRQSLGVALTRLINNFNQMAAALASVDQQRVVLLGNVTHELRTPLTSLRGYLEGLQDGVFSPDQETIAVLQQEVGRLSRLVEDLQLMANVESGEIELNIEAVDLGEIARQVVVRLTPQAQEKGIDLSVRPAGEGTVLATADRDRTVQILTNLVGNALRYTPAGGLIALRVGHQLIENGPMGEVAVIDSGIGIPAEALPYLFERFYRVDASRSRASGGSGVGLTIARHLAWQMGGELTAASPGPGGGSTFTLTLPIYS